MGTQTLLEIIGLLAGGGGAATFIARLTRLVVAVEGLVDSLRNVTTTVQAHETRLAHVEGQLQGSPMTAVPVVPVTPAVQPPRAP